LSDSDLAWIGFLSDSDLVWIGFLSDSDLTSVDFLSDSDSTSVGFFDIDFPTIVSIMSCFFWPFRFLIPIWFEMLIEKYFLEEILTQIYEFIFNFSKYLI
jgi:hypothetical protein